MYRSQNNEAEVILNYFQDHIGALLSIGENNGLDFSNAYDLIQAGWKAVLVEPGQSAFDKLQMLHKYMHTVYCYNFGIGEISGNDTFYSASDSLLSTKNPELLERWDTVTHEEIIIPFLTFKDALLQFKVKKFDFITIDAEGMDWKILKQMNLPDLGCRCVCAEHNSDSYVLSCIKSFCRQNGLMHELLYNSENIIMAR